DRRCEAYAQRDRELDVFVEFLKTRGAISADKGIYKLLASYADKKPDFDVLLFIVAPRDNGSALTQLHESSQFKVTTLEEMQPSHLFSVAAGKHSHLLSLKAAPGDNEISYALRMKMIGDLETDAALWQSVGCNITVFEHVKKMARREVADEQRQRFLVEGLIPCGSTTLLVGSEKSGKSTLMTQLAVTVASGGGDFCGLAVPTESCGGMAVLICGEDPENMLA